MQYGWRLRDGMQRYTTSCKEYKREKEKNESNIAQGEIFILHSQSPKSYPLFEEGAVSLTRYCINRDYEVSPEEK